MKWLHRIRPINILIILATQLLVYLFYSLPISIGDVFHTDYPSFKYYFIIAVITCIVVTAGYIINDIFDSEIDKINKPKKAISNPSRWMIVYKALFIIGLSLVVFVSYQLKVIYFTPIYLLTWFLLYQYSRRLKCMPLIGNLVVALLSSAAVLIVMAPAFHIYKTFDDQAYYFIFLPVYYYTIMAFLLSFMREVVKDMEDVNGDGSQKCQTMAVKFGLKITRTIVQGLHLITIVLSIGFAWLFLGVDRLIWVGFIGILIILLLFQMVRLNKASAQSSYRKIQKFYKLIMVMGILVFLLEPYIYEFLGLT